METVRVQLASPSGKLGELHVSPDVKISALEEQVGTAVPDDADSLGSVSPDASSPLSVTLEHADVVLVEVSMSSSMGGSRLGTLRLPGSTTAVELKGHVQQLAEAEGHRCPPAELQVLKVDSTKLSDADSLRGIAAEPQSPVQVTVHSRSPRDSFAVDLLGVLMMMGFAQPTTGEDAGADAAAAAALRTQAKKRQEAETLQRRESTRQGRPPRVQARTTQQQVRVRPPLARRGR